MNGTEAAEVHAAREAVRARERAGWGGVERVGAEARERAAAALAERQGNQPGERNAPARKPIEGQTE